MKKFEIGKCYRHNGGEEIRVVGRVFTTLYGWCLVGESNLDYNLKPLGMGIGCAANWKEISQKDWMRNFQNESK